jgi:hypothetical protein
MEVMTQLLVQIKVRESRLGVGLPICADGNLVRCIH